jgi:hypothetical protein
MNEKQKLDPSTAADHAAFATLLQSADGRRVLWRVLSLAGTLRLSYVAGCPEQTAFNEGRRSIGLEIMGLLIKIDAHAYQRMMLENTETP